MLGTVKKILIGASVVASMSAIASTPAQALSISFNDPSNIQTYTGGSNGSFIPGNTALATSALTDSDITSNVELWYKSEIPLSHVGFTATEGAYSATVTSVTASDWGSFGSQWLNDLLSVPAYAPFKSLYAGFSAQTKLAINAFLPALGMGDPNIGDIKIGSNGGVALQLIGHLDVKSKLADQITASLKIINSLPPVPQLNGVKTDLTNFQTALNGFSGSIQASEIARVVTGGQTYYAYGFNPTATGITASDDHYSYSAAYSWNTPGYVPPTKSVPEPSAILGLMAVGGMLVASRKLTKTA